MRKIYLWILIILMPLTAYGKKGEIELDVKQHTFSNGLELLVLERHFSPTFFAIVRFKVGSADEKPGITGTAHLLEHMLFKGTKNIGTGDYQAEVPIMTKIDSLAHQLSDAIIESRNPFSRGKDDKIDSLRNQIAELQKDEKKYIIKDELAKIYRTSGGTGLNASTGNDGTQYYVSLPSNKLELWAYLESDRLAGPILREFYSERDVVYEERRLRIDNSPTGKLWEQLNATAFSASSYAWPVLGWSSDIQTVLREQVAAFFEQYYSPNNVVIAVVGDVKFDEVVKLIDKYFGSIPPSKKPVPPVTTVEPEQDGEKRVEVTYDAEPQMAIGWHMPAGGAVDQEVFDVISSLLTDGRTSRLYKSLVVDKQLVSSIDAGSGFTRFPDIFVISATPKEEHPVEEVEGAIYEEIAKLQADGPTEWEMKKIFNQIEAGFLRGLASNRGMGFTLADIQAKTGDWKYLMTDRDKVLAVTADEVKRVLGQYFTEDNRTVAYIVKPDKGEKNNSSMIRKYDEPTGVAK